MEVIKLELFSNTLPLHKTVERDIHCIEEKKVPRHKKDVDSAHEMVLFIICIHWHAIQRPKTCIC